MATQVSRNFRYRPTLSISIKMMRIELILKCFENNQIKKRYFFFGTWELV